MSELPWTKWYCADWLSDPCLSRCSPATRGIWKDALDAMILSSKPSITGTTSSLARICRCSEQEFIAAKDELKSTSTAEIEEHDGNITITNRKLLREHNIKKLRRKAGLASAKQRQHLSEHDESTKHPTRSASVYAYASSSPSSEEEFKSFWNAYPRKVGKQNAKKAWNKIGDRPKLDLLLSAISNQMKSQQWQKDGGQYIPHPATWLNQGRWEDETTSNPYALDENDPTIGAL